MKRLSKKLYLECIQDANKLKAIALLVYIRNNFKGSCLHTHNLSELANKLNIHYTVIYRSFKILKQLGIVEKITTSKGKKIIILKSTQTDNAKINIKKLQNLSYEKIIKALQAMFIVYVQKKKLYISQKVFKTLSALNGKHASIEDVRSYKCLQKQGLIEEISENPQNNKFVSHFNDNGISYDFIAKKLKIGRNKVSEIIKFGQNLNLFKKENRKKFIPCENPEMTLKFMPNAHYKVKGGVVSVLANAYSI